MEETTVLNLGVDPGFGYFKMACVGAQGAQVAVVPSVVIIWRALGL